jgi:hypothetical protein
MWPNVRRYAHYITEKITSYRVMAFDFCKVKRGRDDGLLRTMATDNVSISIHIVQLYNCHLVAENTASVTKSSRCID